MAIEDVSLYENIQQIVGGAEYGTRKIFECFLIIDQFQLKTMTVNSYVFDRDYRNNYGDSIIIEVTVPMGTYSTNIYPYRKKLMVQIQASILDSKGVPMDPDGGIDAQLFRATILDSRNPSIINASEESENANLGDTSTLIDVSLQLTDPLIEIFRQTNLQTIVKHSDLKDIIKCFLGGNFQNDDSFIKANGVNVVEPDNTKVYDQIIFPPTLNIINFVDWLQEYYGVYNNGIGLYLQKKKWYVFPLLQTDKFKADDRSVTIVSLPPSKMTGSEKTFNFVDNHLVILATGEKNQEDNSDSMERNIGNGVRYINADKVIDSFSNTTNGLTSVQSENNVIEYKSLEREDGLNLIPFYEKIASANHSKILSNLALNRVNTITVTWENSFPDLLLPGMSVKYLYRDNNQVKTITGTLINILHRYHASDKGMLQNIHSALTEIMILAQSDGLS